MFFRFWRAIGSHIGNGLSNDETSKSLVFVGEDESITDQNNEEKTWNYVGVFKGAIMVRRFYKCKKFNASKLMIIMEQLGLDPL